MSATTWQPANHEEEAPSYDVMVALGLIEEGPLMQTLHPNDRDESPQTDNSKYQYPGIQQGVVWKKAQEPNDDDRRYISTVPANRRHQGQQQEPELSRERRFLDAIASHMRSSNDVRERDAAHALHKAYRENTRSGPHEALSGLHIARQKKRSKERTYEEYQPSSAGGMFSQSHQ